MSEKDWPRVYDPNAAKADRLVADYILRKFRAGTDPLGRWANESHLGKCPDAFVEHLRGGDGFYGCETGCEYFRLQCVIRCPHGESEQYEYGDFGDMADLMRDMERERSQK